MSTRIKLNKGPCLAEPDKYKWVVGKGCFTKTSPQRASPRRASPVRKPTSPRRASPRRASPVEKKIRKLKAECLSEPDKYKWIVGKGCFEKITPRRESPRRTSPVRKPASPVRRESPRRTSPVRKPASPVRRASPRRASPRRASPVGKKIQKRKAECLAEPDKYKWIVGKGCFEKRGCQALVIRKPSSSRKSPSPASARPSPRKPPSPARPSPRKPLWQGILMRTIIKEIDRNYFKCLVHLKNVDEAIAFLKSLGFKTVKKLDIRLNLMISWSAETKKRILERRDEWASKRSRSPQSFFGEAFEGAFGRVNPNKKNIDILVKELGIQTPHDCEAIKKLYKRWALKNHPDKGGNTELFRKVATAYRELCNN